MTDKTVAALQKFFTFNHPVYSGTLLICKECQEDYWVTGQEFKSNTDDGFRKIFIHSSDCETHTKLMAELRQSDADIPSTKINKIIEMAIIAVRPDYYGIEFEYKVELHRIELTAIDYLFGLKNRESLYMAPDIIRLHNEGTLGEILIDNYKCMAKALMDRR